MLLIHNRFEVGKGPVDRHPQLVRVDSVIVGESARCHSLGLVPVDPLCPMRMIHNRFEVGKGPVDRHLQLVRVDSVIVVCNKVSCAGGLVDGGVFGELRVGLGESFREVADANDQSLVAQLNLWSREKLFEGFHSYPAS